MFGALAHTIRADKRDFAVQMNNVAGDPYIIEGHDSVRGESTLMTK